MSFAQLYIERWIHLFDHQPHPWILFSHGTTVVLDESQADLSQQASDLIAQWRVQPGTPSGDFGVLYLSDIPGWVITSGHPKIRTYLAPEEVDRDTEVYQQLVGRTKNDHEALQIYVGTLGRAKRDADARERTIIFRSREEI